MNGKSDAKIFNRLINDPSAEVDAHTLRRQIFRDRCKIKIIIGITGSIGFRKYRLFFIK